jgi:hypothetical protein
VAALRELTGGRTDLLAEVAGTAPGFSAGQMNKPLTARRPDWPGRPGRPGGDRGVDRGGPAPRPD